MRATEINLVVSEFKSLYFFLFFCAVPPPHTHSPSPPPLMTAPVLTRFYLLLDHCAEDLNILAWSSGYREASHVREEHVSYPVIPTVCVAILGVMFTTALFQDNVSDSTCVNSFITRLLQAHQEVLVNLARVFILLFSYVVCFFVFFSHHSQIISLTRLYASHFSYTLPLKDSESSWEEKLLRLWRFLSLREHVLSFCLALSASLNPPLTRVSAECTALRWPGCSHVRACVCVFVCVRAGGRARSSDCALYTPNVKRAPCHRETDGDVCHLQQRGRVTHAHAHTGTRQRQPPTVPDPPAHPPQIHPTSKKNIQYCVS